MRKPSPHRKPNPVLRLYGRHAVEAALGNPQRRLRRLYATAEALATVTAPPKLEVRTTRTQELDRLAPHAPHQGLVLEADPLELLALDDVLRAPDTKRALLVLDQITDPHNVGAILRSALAFDAVAVVTQDRHSPPESGALAKAASGALELMPWVRVTNIARTLEMIAEAGYWRVGLAGDAPTPLAQALSTSPSCLVLGAEGEGLRPNVAAHCDCLARLPMSGRVESLNVSNAAAVALYATGIHHGS
jgi:23S rRNA (guanosine2251-2'-O)-methyltransferase